MMVRKIWRKREVEEKNDEDRNQENPPKHPMLSFVKSDI